MPQLQNQFFKVQQCEGTASDYFIALLITIHHCPEQCHQSFGALFVTVLDSLNEPIRNIYVEVIKVLLTGKSFNRQMKTVMSMTQRDLMTNQCSSTGRIVLNLHILQNLVPSLPTVQLHHQ